MRSLLPSTRGNALLIAVLAALELFSASLAGFTLYPFLLCSAVFAASVVVVLRLEKTHTRFAARTANLLCVLLILKVSLVLVAATGGVHSEFMGVLYVPIFLAALFYYIPGSLGVGVSISAFLLFSVSAHHSWGTAGTAETVFTLSGVFLFVSLIAGIFSHGLTYSAKSAARQVQIQQHRMAEFEWFRDTATMMESLGDLQAMLSAGLMRLQDLLPCETAVIYLRETEGLKMRLEEFISPNGEPPSLIALSLEEQAPIRSSDFEPIVAFWPETRSVRGAMGAFRRIDFDAGSMMAVSLRSMDDIFGAVVVSARTPGEFTARHRDLFLQFAKHVAYPILRIRLHAQATTDTLTGLNNHRAFRQRLQEEMERSQRYKHPMSLIMLDLDHFKRVNDTQGHPAGDAILAQVGTILRRGSRATDMVARYGGEEMVILCPETGAEEALVVAKRIRETIADSVFQLPGGGVLEITVSLGIASAPGHGLDPDTIIKAADQALYDAKARGRNRVCVASPTRTPAPAASP